jgi:hypothetical protein
MKAKKIVDCLVKMQKKFRNVYQIIAQLLGAEKNRKNIWKFHSMCLT